MSSLIAYFKPNSKMTKYDAYYYAALVMVLNISQCLYIHNYIINVQQLAIEIKTAFSSLLYRKALKLTPSALSEISLGNIVTLITKDVHTFYLSIWMINDTWIGIVRTLVICYLLYAKIGVTTFIGIGVLFSVLPLQSKFFKKKHGENYMILNGLILLQNFFEFLTCHKENVTVTLERSRG